MSFVGEIELWMKKIVKQNTLVFAFFENFYAMPNRIWDWCNWKVLERNKMGFGLVENERQMVDLRSQWAEGEVRWTSLQTTNFIHKIESNKDHLAIHIFVLSIYHDE